MTRRKQDLLDRAHLMGPGHRVRVLDAFAPSGSTSLAALADELDPEQGTAVITEGLINYFPMSGVVTLWDAIASTLHRFPRGLYLSDLHLDRAPGAVTATAKAFMKVVVRGDVYLHFDSEQDAIEALRDSRVRPRRAVAAELVRRRQPGRASTATTLCAPRPATDDQGVGGSLTSESCSSSTLTSRNVRTLTFLTNRAVR